MNAMQALSGLEILRIWELGLEQHPLDRALITLNIAFPERSWDELVTLSIGRRDDLLLTLREHTFGSRLMGLAVCPGCQDRLEFALDIADIHTGQDVEAVDQEYQMTVDDYELHFRLLNSTDLAAIAGYRDVPAAHRLLVERCVVRAWQNGAVVDVATLPETAFSALAKQMARYDPQAEVVLDLNCATCGQRWQTIFDIVLFLWGEICAQAKRLLREVHTLAQSYGWREVDILSMSAARRQFYLEMAT
jgi:hypothetical protein